MDSIQYKKNKEYEKYCWIYLMDLGFTKVLNVCVS